MRKKHRHKQFENYLAEKLSNQLEDGQYKSTSFYGQQTLQRITADSDDPQCTLQGTSASSHGVMTADGSLTRRLAKRISMRTLVGSIALAIAVAGIVLSTTLFRSKQNLDVLALAADKYNRKTGIVYFRGKRFTHTHQPRRKGRVHDRVFDYRSGPDRIESWSTTDGLYVHDLIDSSPHPIQVRWEFLNTPDGSCSGSSDQRGYVSVNRVRSVRDSDQVEARSCPFGLGLRPRVRQGDPKAREFQKHREDVQGSIRMAAINPGAFIRKIQKGGFTRHSVRKAVESGRDVYRIKAWQPVEWIDDNGRKRLLDDFEVITLVLDRKTLNVLRYEDRSEYSVDGHDGFLELEQITFDQPPIVISENTRNEHLLRMSFALSRVDKDPFDTKDRRISKQVEQEQTGVTIGRHQNRPN